MIIQPLIHFLLGFGTSFIGSIPLGAINATTIRISMTYGVPYALRFILGATIAELFYSYSCVQFSGYLLSIPSLEFYIQLFSIPVFLILGISYWIARPKKETGKELSANNIFVQGLSIGFLNPLQIPFWLAYTTYFLSAGWIRQDVALLNIFIVGIILGSSILLYILARFASTLEGKIRLSEKTINQFTAVIFLMLALYQVGRLTLIL